MKEDLKPNVRPDLDAAAKTFARYHRNFCFPHEIFRLEATYLFGESETEEQYTIFVMHKEEADKLPMIAAGEDPEFS